MSPGFSTARLARLHETLSRHAAEGDVPGLVTLVSRRGETHVEAIGMQAVGGSVPMKRDTIFRMIQRMMDSPNRRACSPISGRPPTKPSTTNPIHD